jgi:hypothetical protein
MLHPLPLRPARVVAVDLTLTAHVDPVALVAGGGLHRETEPGPAPVVPARLDHRRALVAFNGELLSLTPIQF